ncbi:hypothetical protein Q3G72_015105 [Acer saccharum]|nr:hypothetical protein Q3G72_015105 [Acer saccharum]
MFTQVWLNFVFVPKNLEEKKKKLNNKISFSLSLDSFKVFVDGHLNFVSQPREPFEFCFSENGCLWEKTEGKKDSRMGKILH